jgi:hypothetical protein
MMTVMKWMKNLAVAGEFSGKIVYNLLRKVYRTQVLICPQ